MPAKSTLVRSKNLFDFCMRYEYFSQNYTGQNLNKI